MRDKHFQRGLVTIKLRSNNRRANWRFQRSTFFGTMYEYSALDRNFSPPHRWTFDVCVPRSLRKGAYIVVRPGSCPQAKYSAGVERRSLNFAPATKPNYRRVMYAKLFLADPTYQRNRIVAIRGQKHLLPPYIRRFRLRLKGTVATTRGNDATDYVAVVRPGNHRLMIRLFFALKPWILYNHFVLP